MPLLLARGALNGEKCKKIHSPFKQFAVYIRPFRGLNRVVEGPNSDYCLASL